jgi:hypothetical protein
MHDYVERVKDPEASAKLKQAQEALARHAQGQPFVFPGEAKILKMPHPLAELANELAPGSILTLTIQTPQAKPEA